MKEIINKIFFFFYKNKTQKVITILGIKITKKIAANNEKFLIELNKKISNIEFKQNLIMDYFINSSNAAKATGQLRKFQLECLELLKNFEKICNQNNLVYWLDFGSLLGAIRHKGFIPWDDDLDVSMPQDSFNKFREIAKNLVPEPVCFIDREPGRMARLQYKKNSKAFIDIYCYFDKNETLQTNLPFVNLNSRKPIKKEILLPVQKIEFEGSIYSAPNDPDTYLRIRYGNYSLLPKKPNLECGHEVINEYLE